MSKITNKWISNDAVSGSKIRLNNDENLKARNAANSADVNILKVNASDKILFDSVPQVAADPSSANDLVRKSYLDARLEGLKPKEAVRIATTTAGTLATDFENGDSIDGVTLATGDRILIKNQASALTNGIYIVAASGAPSRAADFNASSEIAGAYVAVQEGTENAGKVYVQSGTFTTLDTDAINFVFFNSTSGLVGGDGITVSGSNVSVDHDGNGLQFTANQLALELDGSTLSKSATGLKVADAGITATQIAAAVAGAGLAGGAGTALSVNVDDSTIEINTDTLRVKDSGITTAKIANDAVDKDKIAADVAGNGLGQNANGSLEIKVATASGLEIATDELKAKVHASTMKINGSNELESLKAHGEILTLNGTDITNGYKDLANTAYSAASIMVTPKGGVQQENAIDYSISLSGGAGGVTRVTWSALGLDTVLESGDKLIVQYSYL